MSLNGWKRLLGQDSLKRPRSKQRTLLHKSQEVQIGILVMDTFKHIISARDVDVNRQIMEVRDNVEVNQIMESCEGSFVGWMAESLSADQ